MTSKISLLSGLKVTNIELTSGDAGIRFDNGAVLIIYNKFSTKGVNDLEVGQLEGKIVVKAEENNKLILIRFNDDSEIVVDMHDEAYTGPEALQLRIPGMPIIIWN